MLTEKDLLFMQQARTHAAAGRTTPVHLLYEIDNGVDEWTGEPMLQVLELPVEAVVTELSGSVTADIIVQSGFTVDKADIQLSVGFDQLAGYENEKPQAVIYRNEKYIVTAADRKGVGADNRLEIAAAKAAI